MEQVSDRERLKDKIIDKISKAIKSIQELLYYKSKDPLLAGSAAGLILCNGDWVSHKLCENLDHALLHGLKQVTHGYWRVIKQLSHKEMVKEIDLLTNVTTDLGKGRAWLYASLNEGNLESYIRLICDNDKLLKKFYAKEALMLDEDRMNILLTHTSGLEYVKFQLDYDVPYLDLSAYPPRSQTNSEPEDSVGSNTHETHQDFSDSFQSGTEVCTSSTDSTCNPASDSDSASIASMDTHSQSESVYHMKISTISADSGCPSDGISSDGAKHSYVTPNEVIRHRIEIPVDNISLCSISSSGDPDRHKRLENIVPGGDDDDDGEDSFQVIRVRSKKGNNNKSKKKKHVLSQKENLDKNRKTGFSEPTENLSELIYKENHDSTTRTSPQNNKETNSSVENISDNLLFDNNNVVSSNNNGGHLRKSLSSSEGHMHQPDNEVPSISITKFDSGIDICDFTVTVDEYITPTNHSTDVNDSASTTSLKDQTELSTVSPDLSSGSKSVHAQIETVSVGVKSDISGSQGSDVVPLAVKQSSDSNRRQGSKSPSHNTKVAERSNQRSTSSAVNSRRSEQSSNIYNQRQIRETSNNDGINSSYSDQLNHNDDKVNAEKIDDKDSLEDGEDNFDVYSRNKLGTAKQLYSEPDLPLTGLSSVQSTTQLQDYVDYILQSPESPPVDNIDKLEVQEKETDLSLRLDNNTTLQVMLDIFTHEDEKLLKMFVTRENHSEGDSGVVFVLISDQCLYLLHYRKSTKKFVQQSSAMLLDLLFISTGINEQTLNIESRGKNNQKQRMWLTPGHQALTLAIVTCLTDAVQAASEHILPGRSGFSVESEVPLQNIALKKYISRELQCEAQDVTVSDYSLVFWEDPSFSSNQSQDADAAYKEGTLLLRSQDPLKAYVWKPVYIVLKTSMLCVSNKKSDLRPHSYLGLGGDQCIGCRSTSTTDREHCVELILAQGGSWFLAAASQAEISEWRHALCLAVSQGTVENSTPSACIPCCAVLSCNQLFLCHEDLHTKFYRTLGRAQLEDVTGIAFNDVNSTYCIIEFESQETGVSSNQWVLYFSSAQDLQRYKRAISAAWMEIYQVELSVLPIKSVTLQRHCLTLSEQLRQQLTLK